MESIALIDRVFEREGMISSIIIFSLETDDVQWQLLWKSQVRRLAGRRRQFIRCARSTDVRLPIGWTR